MELQEFIVAVENLLGVKHVEEDQLNLRISNERISVGIQKQFLGGQDVWLSYPGSEHFQPANEDLADAFRRVQKAFDRTNTDWYLYEAVVEKALKSFQGWVKLPLEYTAEIRDHFPGYSARIPGLGVELFYITCSAEGDALANRRLMKTVMRSKKAEPGHYAIECREVNNKLFLQTHNGRKTTLFEAAGCENVWASMRQFEILPDILGHHSTDGAVQEMPDIEVYNQLTQRREYTFLELVVK